MEAIGSDPPRSKSPSWEAEVRKDAEKLLSFVSLYCRRNHSHRALNRFEFASCRTPVAIRDGDPLCGECTRLLRHAIVMRVLCPLDPKPKCRKCPQNCYRPEHREGMERVMRYSGPLSLLKKIQRGVL